MNDKEYTYDIDKYTIGVDTNGEDGIGLTVAKIENGEINFLGNCYGENARCIDLLIKENQELKSQLKGTTHCFVEEEHEKLKKQLEDMTDCRDIASGHRKEVQDRETILLNQQKEFIKYLEDEINKTDYEINILGNYPYLAWSNACKKNLQKYKSIIGDKQ